MTQSAKTEREQLFQIPQYPRSSRYDMNWVARHEMGPNALWLTEALSQVMTFTSGMRVLDLGCGTALSSIFLAREFGVQVWATDLWISASDNLKRIQEAGLEDRVFPVYAEARHLPYADGFFDAIVSLDAYHYFGTDVHYLDFHLLKLLKPGGQVGIVSPASPAEMPHPLPMHLDDSWYWLNSVDWWRNLWERCPGFSVDRAEMLPNGWELWMRWHAFLDTFETINPHNDPKEMEQLRADGGKNIGFIRMVGSRVP